MKSIEQHMANAAARQLRAENEFVDDAIQAAWLARLPVSHVEHMDSGMYDRLVRLVLPGGYVFASRLFVPSWRVVR